MIEVKCSSCGKTVHVPENLVGMKGTCPSCDESLQVPGTQSVPMGGGHTLEKDHFGQLLKDAFEEPSMAPRDSDFRRAQREKWIPGVYDQIAWLAMGAAVFLWKASFLAVLGQSSDWPIWLLIGAFLLASIGAISCVAGTASVMYTRYTGRIYTRGDRVGFARAGGYDIGRWAPIIAFLAVFGVYWGTFHRFSFDPISFIRNPWLFILISVVIAHILTLIGTRRVFRARFGKPRSSIPSV